MFRHSQLVCSLAVTTVVLVGCGEEQKNVKPKDEDTMSAVTGSNRELLDEVNQAGTWFRAKKTRPIWAQLVTEDRPVETLEGVEEVKAGDFLCRGEIGEVWPQSADSLSKKYVETDEIVDGWRKYNPRPDAEGVMAAQVEHEFHVHASWGELSGKPGDYLVKNFADKDESQPDDVWIVDQALFAATYERTGE